MLPYKGDFKVTQEYKGKDHKGIDMVGLDSKKIYSTVDGIVLKATKDTYYDGGMGNYVKILDKSSRRHLFAHLSEFYVEPYQTIKIGDLIGLEGNSGHSFGSHLHYEIRADDTSLFYQDCTEFLQIENKVKEYRMTKEEAKEIVKEKAELSDATIQYIADDYRYGNELILKLAKAMEDKYGKI